MRDSKSLRMGFDSSLTCQRYGKESRHRMVWRQVIYGSEKPAFGEAPTVSSINQQY